MDEIIIKKNALHHQLLLAHPFSRRLNALFGVTGNSESFGRDALLFLLKDAQEHLSQMVDLSLNLIVEIQKWEGQREADHNEERSQDVYDNRTV